MLMTMITRRDAALALDIPLEMARRHGIPSRLSEEDLAEIVANPPQWLLQSRANRTGKRPVWVELRCYVCGFSEAARPKKWWPEFTYVICEFHDPQELPELGAGMRRSEFDGVGSRFIGIVEGPVAGS